MRHKKQRSKSMKSANIIKSWHKADMAGRPNLWPLSHDHKLARASQLDNNNSRQRCGYATYIPLWFDTQPHQWAMTTMTELDNNMFITAIHTPHLRSTSPVHSSSWCFFHLLFNSLSSSQEKPSTLQGTLHCTIPMKGGLWYLQNFSHQNLIQPNLWM